MIISFGEDTAPDVDETDGKMKQNLENEDQEKEEKGKFSYQQDSMKMYKRMFSRNKEEQARNVSKVDEGEEENDD